MKTAAYNAIHKNPSARRWYTLSVQQMYTESTESDSSQASLGTASEVKV